MKSCHILGHDMPASLPGPPVRKDLHADLRAKCQLHNSAYLDSTGLPPDKKHNRIHRDAFQAPQSPWVSEYQPGTSQMERAHARLIQRAVPALQNKSDDQTGSTKYSSLPRILITTVFSEIRAVFTQGRSRKSIFTSNGQRWLARL